MTLIGRGKSGVFIIYLPASEPPAVISWGLKYWTFIMYLLTIEFPAMEKCLETLKLEVSTGV
jgi:hypothetical protein